MPRQPRCIEPGTTYHLISRFVDREWFIKTESERELYLKLLANALEESDWRLLSYAIMSNHLHLGAVAGTQPLGEWIRRVHSPFADAMNRTHKRIGNVFVRGPKALPVVTESFGHLVAYIHNNPVRAGVCSNAASSNWTSHRAYIGLCAVPAWLHVEEGLARAGHNDALRFDAWVNDAACTETDAIFNDEQREPSRVVREISVAAVNTPKQATAEMIVSETAAVLGIGVAQLRSASRGYVEVVGRAVAVQCAQQARLSGAAIARSLNISAQRVSIVRRQEPTSEIRAACARVSRRIARASLSCRA